MGAEIIGREWKETSASGSFLFLGALEALMDKESREHSFSLDACHLEVKKIHLLRLVVPGCLSLRMLQTCF